MIIGIFGQKFATLLTSTKAFVGGKNGFEVPTFRQEIVACNQTIP
jgi:hypothetical protein